MAGMVKVVGSIISAPFQAVNHAAVFAYYSMHAIWDPTNATAVSAVGELTSLVALERMKKLMMSDLSGRAILLHQPIVTDEVLAYATTLPEHTFGNRYAAYMNYNGFKPSGRNLVTYIADPTLKYIMLRYRQCHDFLHAITGCGRSVEEELAVKILEWCHTGLPLGLLAVPGGAVHLTKEQLLNMKVYWKWAHEHAPQYMHNDKTIPFYLNVPWENMLDRPLEEVISATGLTPVPEYLERLHKKDA